MTDLEIINQLLYGNHVEKKDLISIEKRLEQLLKEVKIRLTYN
jgi:hypothetical protein